MLNPGEVGACVTVEPAKEAATPRSFGIDKGLISRLFAESAGSVTGYDPG